MLNIVVKEMKEFIREKSYLFFFILFPVLLVFLLGNLLDETDIAESSIGNLKIEYQLDTQDPYQVAAIERFVKAMNNDATISFRRAEDFAKAKEAVVEDAITAAVSFHGDPLTIQVYEGKDRVKNRTVQAILNGFIQNNKTIKAVYNLAPERLARYQTENADYTVEKDMGVERSMIDYYAVSMVVMIAFMSMLVGANAFLGERQNRTINRLIIAPQNRITMFLQKVCGMAPQALIQISIIMLISVVVFKASYGATLLNNLYLYLMFFVITFCMVSLGTIIGLLFKVPPFIIIMPVVSIMMFLGGSYSKETEIKGITNLMPNNFFQKAAFDVVIFGRYELANKAILGCIITTIAALMVGAFLFSRKEEER
jgi:ABC-2 type transport system permease protein